MDCDVIIVGAGLTGLSAAEKLLDFNVCIIESNSAIGGTCSSYNVGDESVEKCYHHFFKDDKSIMDLFSKKGLKNIIEWKKASLGYFINGKTYALDTPFEILRFPVMTLQDKLNLGKIYFTAKFSNIEKYDSILAKDWLLENYGNGIYENFFEPLLIGKYGSMLSEVSAAWLLGRIKIRSNRGSKGEILGYPRGGFSKLLEKLAKDKRILLGETVLKVAKTESGFLVKTNAETHTAKQVIFTCAPSKVAALIDLPLETDRQFKSIKFQRLVCALVGHKNKLGDRYWLNIKRENNSFGAVIEHTNLVPFERYGTHMSYIVTYVNDEADPFFDLSDGEIIERYKTDLKAIFPDFDGNFVFEKVYKNAFAGPIYSKGYVKKIPSLRLPVKGAYIAGMSRMYPDRSLNDAVNEGYAVSDALKQDLHK